MSALLRVARLNAAYAATIDADRLEAWPDFFVEDSSTRLPLPRTTGVPTAPGSSMRTRVRCCAIGSRRYGLPTFTSARATAILLVCRCSARPGRTALRPRRRFWSCASCADGRTDLFATGVYIDRICEKGDNPRFAERIVVCDSGHFDTLLAIPL
jgi:hypothetical protein